MGSSHSSDTQLIKQVSSGDERALGELYSRYGDAVLRFIHRATGDVNIAEDLCQEVFITVAQKAGTYTEQGYFRSWLFGIASNKARSHMRKLWIRQKLLRQHRESLITTGTVTSSPELEALRLAFEQLPFKHREILTLQIHEGLSGDEIAGALNITHEAVRVRLHRAKHKLRELMTRELDKGASP